MHQWKIIPGFARYEACSDGRIRHRVKGTILQPGGSLGGYQRVSLYTDSDTRRTHSVHRLVALTFIDNQEGKATVNHKDHNPKNNHIDNLEWASVTEQNRHKRKCADLSLVSARAVQQIEPYTTNVLATFPSIAQAADAVGAGFKGRTKICAVARGAKEKVTAYGFVWKYVAEEVDPEEEWRPIDPALIHGIAGYHVSSTGRVKNHKGRITSGHKHHSGYCWVSIHPHQFMMHILVAKAFLDNPMQKRIVNHLNGDKCDARVSNLEWVTDAENIIHGQRLKKSKSM